MPKLEKLVLLIAALHLISSTFALTPAVAGKSALLVGINTYSHTAAEIKADAPSTGRFNPVLTFNNLKGPANDVGEMRKLLVDKFHFPGDNVHVLLEAEAKRKPLMDAMLKYLVTDPRPGDTVVLFISSHGSVRKDSNGHGQQYFMDPNRQNPAFLENTVVPYDWYTGVDDIFSRDFQHIFRLAAAKGVRVTAIFDSCHSGSLARGAAGTIPKSFDPDPREMPPTPYPDEAGTPLPMRDPVTATLILSAAQKDQLAGDVQNAAPPHGLFTHALVETLKALPENRSARDVFRRLSAAMELTAGASQQPEMDTSDERAKLTLFGNDLIGADGKRAPASSTTTTVLQRTGNTYELDIGTASDVGAGTEFRTLDGPEASRAVLRVTDDKADLGILRSRAILVGPPGAVVEPPALVEMTKWVPATWPTLLFYTGALNLPVAKIQAGLEAARAAGVTLISDPSKDVWTHHVSWDGTNWSAQAAPPAPNASAKPEKAIVFGADLSLSALKKLPAKAVVWFDPPLPRESAGSLMPKPAEGIPSSSAALADRRDQAKYILGGDGDGKGVRYAWFKRTDIDSGIRTPDGLGAGCSPNSSFPLRTDWLDLDFASTGKNGDGLTKTADDLARLNGWLNLDSNTNMQTGFQYKLRLRPVAGGNPASIQGDFTFAQDYQLELTLDAPSSVSSRWVYVLGIDCQGKGTLIWPPEKAVEKALPEDKGQTDTITLESGVFPVGEPYGTDAYLLITTSSKLANPDALNFSGVVTRGAKGAADQPTDPLERLLRAASAGTRGPQEPIPVSWSVQVLQLQSREKPAPAKQ